MKNFYKIVFFIGLLTWQNVAAEDYLLKLQEDLKDGRLQYFSPIEAALIVSGANTLVELETGKDWFQSILNDIKDKNMIVFMDQEESARRVFFYFHTVWLKQYKKEATTLFDIQFRKEYNCVAATVLYNLTCDELNLDTHAFETPSHVYTIFSNFNKYVMVENTTSMGFNIMQNLRKYSEYLRQYYPEKMVYKIGLDRLYAYENSKGREINNIELIGLICYNQAIFAAEKNDYPTSYEYVRLAQKFNQDSRSNRQFEVNLYLRWGQQLVRNQDFGEAFHVFADACSRYPENEDFEKNCVGFFKNSMMQSWQQKNWEIARAAVSRMSEIDILNDQDFSIQKNMLLQWIEYFKQKRDRERAFQVLELLHKIYPSDKDKYKWESTVRAIPAPR